MIGEKIRQLRKERGLSQNELAERLCVVRQTVSKWEMGLSVPDADTVLRLADVFQVPVSELLGRQGEPSAADLAEELTAVNAQLAEMQREAVRAQSAGKVRGRMLLLTVLALAALPVKNGTAALCVAGVCLLAALAVLYRNLELLTGAAADSDGGKALRRAGWYSAALVLAFLLYGFLRERGILPASEGAEKPAAMGVILFLLVVFGTLAPKLPFNRHVGLRLPWTVTDEETWDLAHRLLGILSLPLAVIYTAAALRAESEEALAAVSVAAVLLFIGIPGVLSGLHFWRKWRNKR